MILKKKFLLGSDRGKKCGVKKCMSKAFAFLNDIKRAFCFCRLVVVAICNVDMIVVSCDTLTFNF